MCCTTHHGYSAYCCEPAVESSSCCVPAGGFVRRYSTEAERKERLEEYIGMLEKELEGARERLKELK